LIIYFNELMGPRKRRSVRERTDDLVCHVLLRAFRLFSKKRRYGRPSQLGTNTVAAGRTELLQDGGVVLFEPTGIQLDRTAISFEPQLAPENGLPSGKERQREETKLKE
jgi:hypothetical protein